MAREHANIKLTPEELRAFLKTQTLAVLATNDTDGGPWVDAVACKLVGERLHFRVPIEIRSYTNIVTDARVCCVVEERPEGSYYGIKGALVHGFAFALGDESSASAHEFADPVSPSDAGRIFSVGLDDVASFAFEKIQYRYVETPSKDAGLS